MGKASDNRVKFNKPGLRTIEKRISQGGFNKELYIYDADSHLAIRVRPEQSYTDSTFCLYARIRVRGQKSSRMYKRQIMKVSEARNSGITISDLRQRVDTLFLEIQEGRDPQLIAKQEAADLVNNKKILEAQRFLRDMIYGSPSEQGDEERLLDGFIAERRPGERYLFDIKNKSSQLFSELLDEPLYELSPDRVKGVYLKKVSRGPCQLNGAMRVLRSVWNWAQCKYDETGLFIRNPVSRAMKQLGVNINRTNRCTGRLDDGDFRPYLRSVLELRDHDHTSAYRNGRDALLFMLFTGVRLTGTVTIRTADIHIERMIFTIVKKGGDRVELPMSSVTAAVVCNRMAYIPAGSTYLFPGVGGRGHYRGTKSVRAIIKDKTGISVTNHDLRRTYKSIGTELGINTVLLDELLSHAREGVDAHYIHPSKASLRNASQKIADYMVEKAGFNLIERLTERW